MEDIAGSAVVRVLKGVGWITFHVVGAVGDVIANTVPWNTQGGRSSEEEQQHGRGTA
ncbi:hypothetical protein R6L23_11680 [Streptomyces sp. SR27]|uniref:hypothetical protein n=1 Tax=Streptomyces sp. SR27 TaxID=3076630 RepID=UPI00295A685E|nr:hypothetical protein [Streptomyces sp. SR27]MDV9188866.1 hypothetical protein [Streptomyces sp. SR27]